MSLGLDLGSTQFRSLRRQRERLVGRYCPTWFLVVEDIAEHRLKLDEQQTQYTLIDEHLVLLGESALQHAELLDAVPRPLLEEGLLCANDVLRRELLAAVFDAVVPMAQFEGEICAMTIPGELLPLQRTPEREFFQQLAARRGYTPIIAGQGVAVALAELGDMGFSGVGISLGASQCEFALTLNGRELARCAIPWGTTEIVNASQDDHSPTLSPRAEIKPHVIADFLTELLLEAGARIAQQDGFRVLSQPVTLACAGGITRQREFEFLLQQAWHRAAWPLDIRGLRVASDSIYTIARGCLIRAKLEAQSQQQRAAA